MNKAIKISVVMRRAIEGSTREYLWAERLSGARNCARIANIPVTIRYGLGDVVEYDPTDENRVIRVISKGTRSCGSILVDPPKTLGQAKEYHRALKPYLQKYAIKMQFVSQDVFVMAVPLNMNHCRLMEIVENSPVDFNVATSERADHGTA